MIFATGKTPSALCSLKLAMTFSASHTNLISCASLIRPIIEYSIIAWIPYTKYCTGNLESVQRKAIRGVALTLTRSLSNRNFASCWHSDNKCSLHVHAPKVCLSPFRRLSQNGRNSFFAFINFPQYNKQTF